MITRFFVFGLIGLVLCFIVIAASWGIADLFLKQADHEMQSWKQEGVNMEKWHTTYATLSKAQFLDPYNPKVLAKLGEAYFLLAQQRDLIPTDEQIQALEKAVEFYVNAIKLGPVSVYTWTNLALVKSWLGEYDAQFLLALKLSNSLGPWEPSIQGVIAEIGIAAWYKLSSEAKEIVFATIERGMHRQARLMSQLINKHKIKYVLCAYGGQKSKNLEFCPSFIY